MPKSASETARIFAIGHCILDLEYRVPAALVDDLGFRVGARHLLDEGQYHLLSAALEAPGAAATLTQRSGGGSAANAIITATRLGASCHFATQLGQDPAGQHIRQELADEGIHTLSTSHWVEHSGQCLVLTTSDAERTMLLYPGQMNELNAQLIDWQALAAARVLFLEGYLVNDRQAQQTVMECLALAHQRDIPVCISLSDADLVRQWQQSLSSWFVQPADLLLANASEAQAWTGLSNPEQAAQALSELAHSVVVTLGSDGAILAHAQSVQTFTAPVTSALSTLGAGDTLAGALLYGRYHAQWSMPEALEFAITCASQKTRQHGPRLPRQQLRELLKKQQGVETSTQSNE
jgi:sugar/nucleoside kinase (ribokinase family)